MNYLSEMTVKTLREVAKQAGLKGYSTMKKDALVSILTKLVLSDIEEAMDENVSRMNAELTYTVPGTDVTLTGSAAMVMIRHERNVRRYNPTMKRNRDGAVILSRKQIRRCSKKLRKYAKEIGFFAEA